MEIEAKYAILGRLYPERLASLDLEPYALHAGEEHVHHDVILDTPALAITGSGHALRIRTTDAGAVLTFKGSARTSGAIHQREELEVSVSKDVAYDRSRWPETIAERVRELAGQEHLSPIVEVRVRRCTWSVHCHSRLIGELMLDEGTISAGGRSERVYELELELKEDGRLSDLETLGSRLLQLLPLKPEQRTKLQRGLALLTC